jgi:hypothetical protein
MPYCDNCDRFLNPNTLSDGGTCPTCERIVQDAGAVKAPAKAPWHFKLLVAAVAGYLGWRAVQLLQWLL